jgi:hypothetical protein
MRGPLSEDRREPWSELKVGDLLSALAFGASFEEMANFLIDNVAEREIDIWIGWSAAHEFWVRRASRVLGGDGRAGRPGWRAARVSAICTVRNSAIAVPLGSATRLGGE